MLFQIRFPLASEKQLTEVPITLTDCVIKLKLDFHFRDGVMVWTTPTPSDSYTEALPPNVTALRAFKEVIKFKLWGWGPHPTGLVSS